MTDHFYLSRPIKRFADSRVAAIQPRGASDCGAVRRRGGSANSLFWLCGLGLALVFGCWPAASHAAQSVTLAWDPNPEPDVAGYRVYYGTESGAYPDSVEAGNTTTTTISGLADNTTYYFVVTAHNTAGLESLPSNEVSTTTDPAPNAAPVVSLTNPLDGAAFESPALISMEATASDSDGSIAMVEFYEGANKLGEDATSPYSFTWSGAPTGAYSLTARAFDNAGAATDSAAVSVTVVSPPPPAAPSTLAATGSSASTIDLSWSDNSIDETGFGIERRFDASAPWSAIATAPADATAFTDTGLAPSTTAHYRVKAVNAAGDSAWSNEASATTEAPVPPQITSFSAAPSVISQGDASTLIWTITTGTAPLTGLQGWAMISGTYAISSLALIPGNGSVLEQRSVTVSPQVTTMYILKAITTHGSDYAIVVVDVAIGEEPVVLALVANEKSPLEELLDAFAAVADLGYPTPFEVWMRQHFGTRTVAMNADTDGDGSSALMEFAFGTDPLDRNSVWHPSIVLRNDRAILRHPATGSGIIITVESSKDLHNWEPANSSAGESTTDGYEATVTWKTVGEHRQFFRFRFSRSSENGHGTADIADQRRSLGR